MTTLETQIVSKADQLENNQTVQKILSGIKINWIDLLKNLPLVVKSIVETILLIRQYIKANANG